jgi:hypothetical protein
MLIPATSSLNAPFLKLVYDVIPNRAKGAVRACPEHPSVARSRMGTCFSSLLKNQT